MARYEGREGIGLKLTCVQRREVQEDDWESLSGTNMRAAMTRNCLTIQYDIDRAADQYAIDSVREIVADIIDSTTSDLYYVRWDGLAMTVYVLNRNDCVALRIKLHGYVVGRADHERMVSRSDDNRRYRRGSRAF